MSNLKDALRLLEEKQFQKARDIMEELLEQNPQDIDILYNLWMCYTELNWPERAIETLQRCLQLATNHSNAYQDSGVRLGILRFGVIHKKVGVFKCGMRNSDLMKKRLNE